MEVVSHEPGPMDGYPLVQMTVDAESPRSQRSLYRRLEVHHLSRRMYAGIGPSCTVDGQGYPGNLCYGFFERLLHRTTVRLTLPAAKTPAIVFDGEGDSPCRRRIVRGQEIFRRSVSASETCAGLPPLTTSSSALLAESLSPMSR